MFHPKITKILSPLRRGHLFFKKKMNAHFQNIQFRRRWIQCRKHDGSRYIINFSGKYFILSAKLKSIINIYSYMICVNDYEVMVCLRRCPHDHENQKTANISNRAMSVFWYTQIKPRFFRIFLSFVIWESNFPSTQANCKIAVFASIEGSFQLDSEFDEFVDSWQLGYV